MRWLVPNQRPDRANWQRYFAITAVIRGERQVAMQDTFAESRTSRTAANGAEAKRIASLAAGADSLFSAGQLEAARRTFKEIARAQTEIGANPAGALRRLANVELALDNTYAAATTLEDVAIAADRFDDPETQLGALVDAMLLYIDLGRRDRQSELVRQMRPLHANHHISRCHAPPFSCFSRCSMREHAPSTSQRVSRGST